MDKNEIEDCLKFRREYKSINNTYPFRGQDKVELTQDGTDIIWSLWGCEIVLCANGHWYVEDTSGG